MFNMQSGQHRQSFPARPPASRATKSNASVLAAAAAASKHTKAVTGLMIDSLNRTVVSCGLDGKVKVSPTNFSLCVLAN
jgi:U3 small nucleolar RNA-associated protein 21